MSWKKCFKCKESKPLSEFYVHLQMGDGHLNKCKECTKTDVKRHRKANVERIREYDRARSKLPHRRAGDKARSKALHRIKANTERTKIYRKTFPLRYKAHSIINHALKSGKLIRPSICEACEQELRLNGHHDDYTKPLEVKWLCSPCHSELHQDLKKGETP